MLLHITLFSRSRTLLVHATENDPTASTIVRDLPAQVLVFLQVLLQQLFELNGIINIRHIWYVRVFQRVMFRGVICDRITGNSGRIQRISSAKSTGVMSCMLLICILL